MPYREYQHLDFDFPEPGTIANQSAEYEVTRRVSAFARALLVGIGGDPLFAAPRRPSGLAGWGHRAQFARCRPHHDHRLTFV